MSARTTVVAVALALAVGLAGGWWLRGGGGDEPPAQAAGRVAASPAAPAGDERPPPGADLPPADALPPEAERYPEYFEDLEGEEPEAPRELPSLVEYPRLEKLAGERLSEVPHRVLGAWDEAQDSPSVGNRRAFVMVVEPDIPDAALERLARDVRDRHRDAVILDVRIYDSERAAIQPQALDGGALAFRHLVARVQKNDRVPLDVIRVRGERVEP